MLCCVVLCYVVLYYVVLCCVVLCCVVLYYVVLCCVVLCRYVQTVNNSRLREIELKQEQERYEQELRERLLKVT